jgi:GT2 family glycosyltransferase
MPDKTYVAKPIEKMHYSTYVDIIIPFYGQYARVSRLLESIFRHTFSHVYRVFLVDDCSPNSEFINTLSQTQHPIYTTRNSNQLGFGGALYEGFKKSEETNQELRTQGKQDYPHVLFMQSDCLVEDVDWLKGLSVSLEKLRTQGVKMVSPRTDNPLGGDPRQEGHKGTTVEDVVLDSDHLSLYCFMCHRELFRHIGGFLKSYPYGSYEDEELAYRMKFYGYKQAVCGNSWVRHTGQATLRQLWRDVPESRKVTMEDNRQRCIKDMQTLRKQSR